MFETEKKTLISQRGPTMNLSNIENLVELSNSENIPGSENESEQ